VSGTERRPSHESLVSNPERGPGVCRQRRFLIICLSRIRVEGLSCTEEVRHAFTPGVIEKIRWPIGSSASRKNKRSVLVPGVVNLWVKRG
jgi:hypothetical protein